ncbi:hypothetical protein ACB092_05G103800 [Castanea dentata]
MLMFLGKSLNLFVGILFGSLDLDLRGQIQILCLDILKRDGFGFEASHVLLQGNALFYVLKLKPPSFPGVQVPSHQTWFIPCHISIRYVTIGAKFGNGELPSNQISMH